MKREGQERGPPCSLEVAHLSQGKQCLSWVAKGKGKGAMTGGREVTRLETDSGGKIGLCVGGNPEPLKISHRGSATE